MGIKLTKTSKKTKQQNQKKCRTSICTDIVFIPFLKREVSKPHIDVTDMKKSIQTYLRDSGWEMRVQNAVYAQLKRSVFLGFHQQQSDILN